MTTGTPRKPPVFGPEPWSELAGRSWSYWDLWFVAVAVADHSGSLGELEAHLVGGLRSRLGGRESVEAKLGHLADLRSRIEDAGLTPADLAPPEVLTDKRVLAKARKKVNHTWLEGRALTPAMVETPRVRLARRSRYGRWNALPVDPGLYHKSFRRHVEVKDQISKYKSFAAVDRVEDRLRNLDAPSLSTAHRLALYRGFHTAGLELADRTDDSHGNVGQLRVGAWHTYLGIDWQAAGISTEDYWADLCDLVVFEPYALDHKEETLPWRRVPASQVKLDAATGLGSERWMPIEAMAESALRSGRRELTLEVFRAADRPGFHQEHLRHRCLALTGVDIRDEDHVPQPKLRVFPSPGGRS
jgi:hypothetical protein